MGVEPGIASSTNRRERSPGPRTDCRRGAPRAGRSAKRRHVGGGDKVRIGRGGSSVGCGRLHRPGREPAATALGEGRGPGRLADPLAPDRPLAAEQGPADAAAGGHDPFGRQPAAAGRDRRGMAERQCNCRPRHLLPLPVLAGGERFWRSGQARLRAGERSSRCWRNWPAIATWRFAG